MRAAALAFSLLLAALLTGFGASSVRAASSLPIVHAQDPCAKTSGYCIHFKDTGKIPSVRSIDFTAPSAGSAFVNFHGSIECRTGAGGYKVVDLFSRIVESDSEAISPDLPGGLRVATVLPATATVSAADSLNLGSTRVIDFKSGQKKTIAFKLSRQRMDPTTSCNVFNAALTVEFFPKGGQDRIATQNPCTDTGETWCESFSAASNTRTIRTITFDAPSAGTALVSFHGTLYCGTESNSSSPFTATTGITQFKEVVSDFSPGGLIQNVVLSPKTTIGTSESFNLASTRAYSLSAGAQKFLFRIWPFNVAAQTTCFIYNATFTVRFTPDNSSVVTQSPCVQPTLGYCVQVGPGHIPATRVQTLKFKPPRDGTALVSLQGSYYCAGSATAYGADLVTQITTSRRAPKANQPGGLAQRVAANADGFNAYNFASARAVNVKAGKNQNFYFYLAGSTTSGNTCYVYNAAMTVRLDK